MIERRSAWKPTANTHLRPALGGLVAALLSLRQVALRCSLLLRLSRLATTRSRYGAKRIGVLAMFIALPLLCLANDNDELFGGGEAAFEARTADHDHAQVEARALRERLAADRVRKGVLEREEVSLLGAIREFDRRIAEQRTKGGRLIQEERALNEKWAVLKDTAKKAQAEYEDAKERLRIRVRPMLRLRNTAISAFFDPSLSSVKQRQVRDALGFVVAYDVQVADAARDKQARAESATRELRRQEDAIAKAKDAIERECEDMLVVRAERQALRLAIQEERRALARVTAEIAASARKLDSELGKIRGVDSQPTIGPGGIASQRGRLPWPTLGRVEVMFGKRVDPATGMLTDHKGIDIRAKFLEPIRAVFDGRVVYRDELEGFGRMLVISHDDAWYSVYAHLENFSVSAGSEVAASQVIGFVGDSGSLKGPYLYFELRNGKKPVDPMVWLRR